ncbi:MAG: UDP-N-acetylmuramoyl-L-alanyl-D-glutamate--2,6-diaminopimelate ligase [Gammaproteobacteria bacterium]|nr:MAG: UDP-N-acetylmuramoyl-L-alanyl-D-glutamate--2,6-diaminopimelate ligase [Gammaproteobacteria bacterium]
MTAPMNLTELFADMDLAVPELRIADITTHSQSARRGGLFLACGGRRSHGLDFLPEVIAAEVAAIAWEPVDGRNGPELPADIIGLCVPGLGANLGLIADRFFARPSARLAVTGITGTNGKSTVAYLVAQALNRLDQTAGYMGTLGYGIGTDLEASSLTTPGCVTVHRRLREMADAGAGHVIMEVSSHALDQQRVAGVRFRTAALTNVSRDHLDYHGSMESYAETKARLFTGTGIDTAVINIGDRYGAQLAGRLAKGRADGKSVQLITVALVNTDAEPDVRLIGHLQGACADGIGLELGGDFGTATLDSSLWGRFNAENLIVATGILLAVGCELDAAVAALAECVAPPGRMQLIRGAAAGPTVIVDYAHTPDALGKALEAVREHTSGQVWCVFGCGGNRDRGKRSTMGAVAGELADRSVVTDDNPRDEDPQAIIADIVAGLPDADDVDVIRDRADAIDFAIRSARADDTILIAGKGHEAWQLIGSDARAFSDAAAARAALGRMA